MVVSNTTPSFEDLFFGGGAGVGSAAGGGSGGRVGSNPFTVTAPATAAKAGAETVTLVQQLQGVSKIRAIKAVREATGAGLKEAKEAVDATFDSIREQLSPDPVGTLRHDTYGTGNYAFAFKPGEYLLIDPARPAYKPATSAENTAAKQWPLRVKGSG